MANIQPLINLAVKEARTIGGIVGKAGRKVSQVHRPVDVPGRVTQEDANWAVKNMGRAPGNSKARGIAKTNRSGTGLSPSEIIRTRTEQPVNARKVDPKVLQERVKQQARGRAIARDEATKTRRPSSPRVANKQPVKRDINIARTTFENGKYKARGVNDTLNDSTGIRTSRPTIETRTSQHPATRGVNVNKGKPDKTADRMVSAAINKGRGFRNPGPREVPQSMVLGSLRKQWKEAGPAQRAIIERQAANAKRKMK
jgi:hypothetical protein